ncbi:MAG TPA: carbohydrate-binding protein [Tepidisphaeraceae bacterium]|jgi:hypothetical protein
MRYPWRRKVSASAMFRAIVPCIEGLENRRLFAASLPWTGAAAAIPGTIQFENYDTGGEGVAYHDTSAANEGGQYRQDGVDLGAAVDTGGGYFVGWTNPGEWTKYTVNVASSGNYAPTLRVANGGAGGTFHISVDGANATGSINMPSTGGWQNWTTISAPNISLSAGAHVLMLSIDSGATGMGNFNSMTLSAVAAGTNTPFQGTPQSVPGTIQFENYDLGGEGVAYHDTTAANEGGQFRQDGVDLGSAGDSGGGYFVGWTNPSEWLKYTVNAALSGNYSVALRVANGGAGGSFHLNVDGANATGSINMPGTGGWQNWTTISAPAISLSVGSHVFTLSIDSGAQGIGNFNSLTLAAAQLGTNTPFNGQPQSVPGTLEFENYDLGGEGVAYHDSSAANEGGQYRTDGVDLSTASDTGGGYFVGWTNPGEWLKYTVNIASSKTYSLGIRVASGSGGGTFHINVDGNNATGPITLPNTGGWQNWTTLNVPNVALPAGVHVLTLAIDSGAQGIGNFNRMTISDNPLSLSWHAVAPIPVGLTEAMGEGVNGKLYAFGGYTDTSYLPTTRVYCYDPVTNSWSHKTDMPVGTTHTGTAVDGQYVYFAGGYPPDSSHQFQIFTTTAVWRYDTVNDNWLAMPSLPEGRGAGNMAIVNHVLHYFSGADANRVDRHEHWALDLNNLAAGWVSKAPIPTARNHVGTGALNGLVYAIGGASNQDADETALSTVEVYDPTTDKWNAVASLPTPRALIMSGVDVVGNRIIVGGGETAYNVPTNQITAYDPTTNVWTQLAPLPQARTSGILKDLGGSLIFTTGHPGFNTDTWIGTFS